MQCKATSPSAWLSAACVLERKRVWRWGAQPGAGTHMRSASRAQERTRTVRGPSRLPLRASRGGRWCLLCRETARSKREMAAAGPAAFGRPIAPLPSRAAGLASSSSPSCRPWSRTAAARAVLAEGRVLEHSSPRGTPGPAPRGAPHVPAPDTLLQRLVDLFPAGVRLPRALLRPASLAHRARTGDVAVRGAQAPTLRALDALPDADATHVLLILGQAHASRRRRSAVLLEHYRLLALPLLDSLAAHSPHLELSQLLTLLRATALLSTRWAPGRAHARLQQHIDAVSERAERALRSSVFPEVSTRLAGADDVALSHLLRAAGTFGRLPEQLPGTQEACADLVCLLAARASELTATGALALVRSMASTPQLAACGADLLAVALDRLAAQTWLTGAGAAQREAPERRTVQLLVALRQLDLAQHDVLSHAFERTTFVRRGTLAGVAAALAAALEVRESKAPPSMAPLSQFFHFHRCPRHRGPRHHYAAGSRLKARLAWLRPPCEACAGVAAARCARRAAWLPARRRPSRPPPREAAAPIQGAHPGAASSMRRGGRMRRDRAGVGAALALARQCLVLAHRA